MSTAERPWNSLLVVPVQHLLATVALVLFATPAAELANRLLGGPVATSTLALWIGVAALLVAPLFVAGVLSLSRLWDFLLLYVLGAYGFVAVGLALSLAFGIDGPSDPVVLEVEMAIVGYGTACVVGYVAGVEL